MIPLIRNRMAAIVVGLLVIGLPAVCHADLTKKQLQILKTEFLPAWQRGNTQGVLVSLNKAMRSMTDEQLVELDQLLTQQKIPASSQLLLETRLMLMRQGLGKELPRPGHKETLLLLACVYDEAAEILDESQAKIRQLTDLNVDSSFQEFDTALWDAHVMARKLEASMTVVSDLVEVLSRRNQIRLDQLEPRQKEMLDQDITVTADELKMSWKLLKEHDISARIRRLSHARKTLNAMTDQKETFLAAWSISQDPPLIQDALKQAVQHGYHFHLAELQVPQLSETVQQTADQASQLAGEELLAKSRLLFEGLHWWFRGRYGMGTDGYGLLKSPAALHDDQAMFALMMPEIPPVPTSPLDHPEQMIPEYDRRHHHIWAWEYRQLGTSTATNSETRRSGPTELRTTTLSRFY